MQTGPESRAALQIVTGAAVETAVGTLTALRGSPEGRRAVLLDTIPELVGYFSEGSAALAVDFYEEERELAGVRGRVFTTELTVADRTVKIRRGVAWASQPLFEDAEYDAAQRLAEVVQMETARPYRDTILANRRQDPEAVGWRRITAGGCKFCRMLADRGAVYRHDTARFAAHENCHCTAQPVFRSNDTGEEASVMQYVASKRKRTAAEQAALREYLNTYYGDGKSTPRGAGGRSVRKLPSEPDNDMLARAKALNAQAQEAFKRGDDAERLRLQAEASSLFRRAYATLT